MTRFPVCNPPSSYQDRLKHQIFSRERSSYLLLCLVWADKAGVRFCESSCEFHWDSLWLTEFPSVTSRSFFDRAHKFLKLFMNVQNRRGNALAKCGVLGWQNQKMEIHCYSDPLGSRAVSLNDDVIFLGLTTEEKGRWKNRATFC